MRGKTSPPYKYKRPWPIEGIQSIKHKTNLLLLSSLPFIQTLTFPTSTCCTSFVSMAFEDTLAGLPSVEQPNVRLPQRGPSRAGVRWILVGLPRRDRSDWLVSRRCKEHRCALHVQVLSCASPEWAPTEYECKVFKIRSKVNQIFPENFPAFHGNLFSFSYNQIHSLEGFKNLFLSSKYFIWVHCIQLYHSYCSWIEIIFLV